MSMPRVKLLVLSNGKHVWYPSISDLNHYKSITEVWIEERLTAEEFKDLSGKRTFLKNK
jgi:hypothetical protein